MTSPRPAILPWLSAGVVLGHEAQTSSTLVGLILNPPTLLTRTSGRVRDNSFTTQPLWTIPNSSLHITPLSQPMIQSISESPSGSGAMNNRDSPWLDFQFDRVVLDLEIGLGQQVARSGGRPPWS